MPIMFGNKIAVMSMFGLNTYSVKSKTLITDLHIFDDYKSLVDIYRATQRKYYPEDDMYLKIKISKDKKENIL